MRYAARFMQILTISLLAACQSAQTPSGAPPARSQQSSSGRSNLEGRWDFRVVLGERTAPGELWLFERGGVYTGTLTVQGTNALPVRSLARQHEKIAMIVDTPEGPVTLDGVIDSAGQTIQGIVTYHEGKKYPLEARRRVASGG